NAVVGAGAVHRVHGQAGALVPDAGVHPVVAIDLHVADDRAGAVFHLDGAGPVGVLAGLAAVRHDHAVLDGDVRGLDVEHAVDAQLAPRARRQGRPGVGGPGPAAGGEVGPELRAAGMAVGRQRARARRGRRGR